LELEMEICIVNENEISGELDCAIKKALCICFPDDAEFFSGSRAWHGTAPAWSVIMKDNSTVAAHVGIVDRTVKTGKHLLRVAGIQNVFIQPEYRGRGLCEKLMNAAMDEALRRGFDAGLLYCVPRLEKVYAKCGWTLLPGKEIIRINEKGEHVPLPAKNITMYFPLKIKDFPDGDINLQGNDW